MIRNADLSDVMKQRSHDHTVDFGIAKSEPHRRGPHVASDPAAVAAGVGIAQIDERNQRAGHGEDLFAIPVLKFHDPVTEHLGIGNGWAGDSHCWSPSSPTAKSAMNLRRPGRSACSRISPFGAAPNLNSPNLSVMVASICFPS